MSSWCGQLMIPLASDGRPRDECLNETVFSSLSEARAVLASWQGDYNGVRPHSGLANKTPWQFRSEHLAVAAGCINGQYLVSGDPFPPSRTRSAWPIVAAH